jgi:hypothetical protein
MDEGLDAQTSATTLTQSMKQKENVCDHTYVQSVDESLSKIIFGHSSPMEASTLQQEMLSVGVCYPDHPLSFQSLDEPLITGLLWVLLLFLWQTR